MAGATDLAGQALYHSLNLYLRQEEATSTNNAASTSTPTVSASASASATSESAEDAQEGRPGYYKIVGIILAICSGLFIGVSFVMKKYGLLKANVKYNEEAGEGYGYLKNFWWWGGMTLMILGEICNFVAYAFVDAILVTPFGALSVVITAILSAIFLKERLSFVGKVGCFLCIVGSVVIALNAPDQSSVSTIQQMQDYVVAPGFLTYAGIIILGSVFTAWWVAPRYGKKSMLVYLSICSLVGGLSVVATQGLGAAIITQIEGTPQFNQWFLYVLLVFVIATLLTEIIYLNKALNIFNAALVTPTYYVYFTSATIVSSAILFQGFKGSAMSITTIVMGFLTICSGVVLLQLSKSAKEVTDSKVFTGDLDDVRTVAEQEEPESEPRADTIRGGASIVRGMSRVRTKRQAKEAHRIYEERMAPVAENEQFEWDGLHRRKTVSDAAPGSLRRRKTAHPPLGMSHFPEDDDNVSDADSEVHPGFFGRIGRKAHQTSQRVTRSGRSPVPMTNVSPDKRESLDDDDNSITSEPHDHVYGLAPGLRRVGSNEVDTSYKGNQHIQWAGSDVTNAKRERADSDGSSLVPPKPPPHAHGNKRQFSLTDIFRNKSNVHAPDVHSTAGDSADRPVSRGALSFVDRRRTSGKKMAAATPTEEERLGLVHGDSSKTLPPYDTLPIYEEEDERRNSREGSDEWQQVSGRSQSSSPHDVLGDLGRQRRRDPYDDDSDEEWRYGQPLRSPRDSEGRTGSRGAFV